MEHLKNNISEILSTEKGVSNYLAILPLLSMVLSYESSIFGILSDHVKARKLQTYQQLL